MTREETDALAEYVRRHPFGPARYLADDGTMYAGYLARSEATGEFGVWDHRQPWRLVDNVLLGGPLVEVEDFGRLELRGHPGGPGLPSPPWQPATKAARGEDRHP